MPGALSLHPVSRACKVWIVMNQAIVTVTRFSLLCLFVFQDITFFYLRAATYHQRLHHIHPFKRKKNLKNVYYSQVLVQYNSSQIDLDQKNGVKPQEVMLSHKDVMQLVVQHFKDKFIIFWNDLLDGNVLFIIWLCKLIYYMISIPIYE